VTASGDDAHWLGLGKTELGAAERRDCDEAEQCCVALQQRHGRSGRRLGEEAPTVTAAERSRGGPPRAPPL
jgi:hypothetical protein